MELREEQLDQHTFKPFRDKRIDKKLRVFLLYDRKKPVHSNSLYEEREQAFYTPVVHSNTQARAKAISIIHQKYSVQDAQFLSNDTGSLCQSQFSSTSQRSRKISPRNVLQHSGQQPKIEGYYKKPQLMPLLLSNANDAVSNRHQSTETTADSIFYSTLNSVRFQPQEQRSLQTQLAEGILTLKQNSAAKKATTDNWFKFRNERIRAQQLLTRIHHKSKKGDNQFWQQPSPTRQPQQQANIIVNSSRKSRGKQHTGTQIHHDKILDYYYEMNRLEYAQEDQGGEEEEECQEQQGDRNSRAKRRLKTLAQGLHRSKKPICTSVQHQQEQEKIPPEFQKNRKCITINNNQNIFQTVHAARALVLHTEPYAHPAIQSARVPNKLAQTKTGGFLYEVGTRKKKFKHLDSTFHHGLDSSFQAIADGLKEFYQEFQDSFRIKSFSVHQQ